MKNETTHNGPDAIGSMTEFDAERVEKEMNRPDDEVTKKRIEFLKLFDPDYKHD